MFHIERPATIFLSEVLQSDEFLICSVAIRLLPNKNRIFKQPRIWFHKRTAPLSALVCIGCMYDKFIAG